MVGWDDPNKNIKLRLGKPLKESNDFDWVKETNPIQYKDLKGYHFFYGGNPKKYIIDDVIGDDLIYIWWDAHNDEYDKNTMNCDTFIHRVKLGNYKLFDNDNKEVNPEDLVYTDNTFDDDERKEIWEQDESDDLYWIKDTKPSRKDKLDFSKERYKTTKNYDGVNIGDKFRPPGSHNIWTVVDKVLHQTRWVSDVYWKKQPKGDLIEIETYWVYIEDENGKTTQKVWDKVKNGKGKKFPGTYKSWEKVIESVNESKKIDRYSITGNQWTDIGKDPNGPFVLWKDAGKPKNVTRITPTGYGRMRDAKKGEWIRYDDVYEDEWEWARATQPIELENPKDWVGRSFGYGKEIIDQMTDDEIGASLDSEEYFTITGIDENGNLTLIKHHPIYGENRDSSTSPRNLRDYISKGKWVWI